MRAFLTAFPEHPDHGDVLLTKRRHVDLCRSTTSRCPA
ncbi:putative leader peptide [Allokutzneria multivorans]